MAFAPDGCDFDEFFASITPTPIDENGDGCDDAIEIEIDVDTTSAACIDVRVDAFLIDTTDYDVDELHTDYWEICSDDVEIQTLYLSVPAGWPPVGWYDVELYLEDACGNVEDSTLLEDAFYYCGPCDFDEFFASITPTPIDENGDGCDDAIEIEIDVDTTSAACIDVRVDARLLDPLGDDVDDIHTDYWEICSDNVEIQTLYLSVDGAAEGPPAGWYDVELYLEDGCEHNEEFTLLDDAFYYCYICDFDEFFASITPTPIDENGDGCDDAIEIEIDVDTTSAACIDVRVHAFLLDPFGDDVDELHTDYWEICSDNVEIQTLYLSVPSELSAGWYDVELFLDDECDNPEEYTLLDDAFYHCVETEEHDVAAVDQTVVENEVLPGTVVDIDVTVTNLGSFTETFDLTCYYDSVELGTILVVDLAPGETRVVTFTWDTTGVAMNTYLITAWADSGEAIVEVDESNNWCNMELPIFVIPEVPLGTVVTVLSMFIAFVGFVGFKRFRPKL